MAETVPFNGTTYTIPDSGETGWGQQVTAWIQNVSANVVVLGAAQTFTGSTTFATQIISTVASGTAPLVIASTTVVTNLNADYLNGNHGTYYVNASNLSSGTLSNTLLPAFTGDATSSIGTSTLTLATVNTSVGSFGSVTVIPSITVNAKGLVTNVTSNTIALSGDVSTSGSWITTLATVNTTVGSFGSTSVVPVLTVNAKGLTTAVTLATISPTAIGAPALSGGYIQAGNMPAFTGDITTSAGAGATTLATVNTTTGTFGSNTQVPVITVNAKGLVTSVTTQTITGGGGSGITYQTISTNTTASTGNGYLVNSASMVTVTLPASPSVGGLVEIDCIGAGGFTVTPNTGQSIYDSISSDIVNGSLVGAQYVTASLVYAATNQWLVQWGRSAQITGTTTTTVVPGVDPFFNDVTCLLPLNGSVQDISGNYLGFTNTGVTFSSSVVKYGSYSASFNGSTSKLVGPTGSATQFSGDFTIEAWIYITNYTNEQTIFSNTATNTAIASATGFYWCIRQTSGWLAVGNSGYWINSGTVVPQNQWNHVSLVRQGSTLQTFLNGASTNTASVTNSFTDGQCNIGEFLSANYFNGYISNFRITNGVCRYSAPFTTTNLPSAAFQSSADTTYDPVFNNTTCLLHFENNLTDSSGNGLVLTNNNVTFNTLSKVGSFSAYFSGSAYVSLAANQAFMFPSDFTVEAWVYPTTTNAYGFICSTLVTTGNATGIGFGFGNGTLIPNIYTGGAWTALGSNTVSQNVWTHLAFVRSGSTISAYTNGVFSGSTSNSSNFSDGKLGIGVLSSTYANNFYTGYIDEFRISQFARYTSNFIPSTTAFKTVVPTAYDPFWQDVTFMPRAQSGNTGTDVSLNALALTLNGTTATSSTTVQDAYAWSFNGSSNYITATSTTATKFPGNFTVEFWAYATVLPTSGNYITIFDCRTSSTGFAVGFMNTAGTQQLMYFDGTNYINPTNTAAPINSWHHHAVVRSGSIVTYYVDGISQGTVSSATNFTDGGLYIGSRYNQVQWYTGYIAGFRITKAARYTANFANYLPTSPFVLTNSSYSTSLTTTSSTGGGLVYNTITANTNALSGAGYICNSGSQITVTLPLTPNIGDNIAVVGSGAGGFIVAPNTGQSIWNGSTQSSSSGFAGTSNTTVGLIYEALNTWRVLYTTGTLSIPTLYGDPFYNNVTFLMPGNNSYQDFSGNGLNVSATNTTFSTAQVKYSGSSIYFNGTSAGITYGVSSAFKFPGDFCVEGWFYFTATASQRLFTCGSTDISASGFVIYTNSSSKVVFNTNNVDILAGSTTLSSGQWYHIAISRQGGLIQGWVNGQYQGNVSYTTNFTDGYCYIGRNVAASAWFSGYMAHIRVTNGYSRYAANFSVPASQFYTGLDNSGDASWNNQSLVMNFDSGFTDQSNNNLSFTNNGPVTISNTIYKTGTGSAYFNGASGTNLVNSSYYFPCYYGGSFTAKMWVYLTTVASGTLWTLSCYSTNTNYIYVNSGILYVGWNSTAIVITGGPIFTNTWTEVELTYNPITTTTGVLTLYQNGQATGTANVSNSATQYQMVIGNYTSGSCITGYIDNLELTGFCSTMANYTPWTSNYLSALPTAYDPFWQQTVICLPFDGNANDVSGNGFVLTNNNSVTFAGTPKVGSAAASFNGSNQSLSLANGTPAFQTYLGDFTAECWINTTTIATNHEFFSTGTSNTTTQVFMDVGAGGVGVVRVGNGTGTIITSTAIITTGTYFHIALVRKGSEFLLFINGSLNQVGSSGSTMTDGGLHIGGSGVSATYWNGLIDQFRFTRAARYTANFTPQTTAYLTVGPT